ncbi:hypothetical protein BJP25_29525 [Actinokineospora bangkokensis]|uniref:Uncharacterized protein n=1 Tax=Actinokineospora bangkokensis TaxID=1193682 RepID=A0A1Q9LFE1_9PSEU|nr:hypothetical protein BJP25_29525 [Actinokineospora bangkokensis]
MVVAAGITAVLLVFASRSLGVLGLGAALSALVGAGVAFPLWEGRGWARATAVGAALLGALCAPAAANAVSGGFAPVAGGALVVVWMVVVVLLLRVDVGEWVGRRG